MQHRFNVIRLWEVPTEQLLTSSGLLPLAVLSETTNPAGVLERVARKIEEIGDETEQNNVAASTAVRSRVNFGYNDNQEVAKEGYYEKISNLPRYSS